jgi:electron transfer flavoprotein alpha subunit
MAGDLLVLVEHAQGKVDSITPQLLATGRRLAEQMGVKLIAAVVGHELNTLVGALQHAGADKIVVVDHPDLASASAEVEAQVLAHVGRRLDSRLLLIGYTLAGMEMAPAVASHLRVNALTNCLSVEIRDGVIVVTRPMFDSTLHAEIALAENEPAVIALQKGSAPPLQPSASEASVEFMEVHVKDFPSRSKVLGITEEPQGDVDIAKADIIVSVGRGIGNHDKIEFVGQLAEALGGVLACSRPVVDVGWLPRERQVGASGKTVIPKVYIACGISGAIQHLTGMRDSRRIIAINKDPNAPIFEVAHVGVVGDLFEIVPALTQAAREGRSES